MSKRSNRPNLSLSQLQETVQAAQEKQKALLDCYEIFVVTPMFGGSANSGDVNKQRLVRSASIRGHLRFWWRATRGAEFKTTDQLRKREVAIFGDTSCPSRVKIWVESDQEENSKNTKNKDMKNILELNRKNKLGLASELKDYQYVLFPFENSNNRNSRDDKDKQENSVQYIRTFKFKLWIRYFDRVSEAEAGMHLSIDNLKCELKAAMWAWVNFGGIGARTRRGCGSLYCRDFSLCVAMRFDKENEFERWFQKNVEKYQLQLPADEDYRQWPTLSSSISIQPYKLECLQSWKEVIMAYRDFRRRANGNRGRSRLPEADSIRRLTGMAEPLHKESLTIPDGKEVAFPCAQFGLPIITPFKHEKFKRGEKRYEREPFTTQLVPKGKDRLASPLIMKTIAVNEEEGWGAIIKLVQPPIEQLQLKAVYDRHVHRTEKDYFDQVKKKLENTLIGDSQIYPNLTYKDESKNPMRQSGRSTSSIEAFLASEEVQRQWKYRRYKNRH